MALDLVDYEQKAREAVQLFWGNRVAARQKQIEAGKADQVTQVSSFKESMQLHDARFLDIVPEPWWGGPTAVMMTVFPSVIFQQQVNSVSTRHIQPDG